MSVVEIVSAETAVGSRRRPCSNVSLRDTPVKPGQLWLVQVAPEGAPSRPVCHVLNGTNIVIYDRALADIVAAGLPLGGYAEPAGQDGVAMRCVRFARDGWSVARLLPARLPRRERVRRVQDIVDELAAAKVAGRLPVWIFAEAVDGIEERLEARFDDLAGIVASYPRDTRLAIVIDAFGDNVAARLHAVAANGLAG
jgi:hypothetical protein